MIRLNTDSTWDKDAKEKGEWNIYNLRLLARYQRLLTKARKENGNIQYWETRIRNLISKNP